MRFEAVVLALCFKVIKRMEKSSHVKIGVITNKYDGSETNSSKNRRIPKNSSPIFIFRNHVSHENESILRKFISDNKNSR